MIQALNGAILVLRLPLFWVISFQTFPANPFNHFLTELQGRQSWKLGRLQVHIIQFLLVLAAISSNKFALKFV
jgi:hypothetical protein